MKNDFKIHLALISLMLVCQIYTYAFAQTNSNPDLDIYTIDLNSLNKFDEIKAGEIFNLQLLDNVSTLNNDQKQLQFKSIDENVNAFGFINSTTQAKRFSMFGSLGFSTEKLVLDDGQEIDLSSSSPALIGIHPPHANTNELNIVKYINSLALASSPLTLGTSIGIAFLTNGLFSAYQNGLHDFIWGGLSGSGFSCIEKVFRKQPDLFIEKGQIIPFTLKEDLKINKGIKKEKVEYLFLTEEEANKQVKQLLQWGDLSGALELSAKTGQKEQYEEIYKQISSSRL